MAGQTKAKYWTAVCYIENMIDGWEQKIDDVLQIPFAYCIHDMDHDQKSEHRKDHVHLIICWNNTTTYKAALGLVQQLSKSRTKCCNTVQPVVSIRHCYDYLIHDTESCRKAGKMQYDKRCRITGNNFDIGAYEQISIEDKSEALREICEYCVIRDIQNFADIFVIVSQSEDFKDQKYWEAMKSYSGMIERVCKGLYLKAHPGKK